jgi:LAS superfamily LD-carboxypeptidase LdcB
LYLLYFLLFFKFRFRTTGLKNFGPRGSYPQLSYRKINAEPQIEKKPTCSKKTPVQSQFATPTSNKRSSSVIDNDEDDLLLVNSANSFESTNKSLKKIKLEK